MSNKTRGMAVIVALVLIAAMAGWVQAAALNYGDVVFSRRASTLIEVRRANGTIETVVDITALTLYEGFGDGTPFTPVEVGALAVINDASSLKLMPHGGAYGAWLDLISLDHPVIAFSCYDVAGNPDPYNNGSGHMEFYDPFTSTHLGSRWVGDKNQILEQLADGRAVHGRYSSEIWGFDLAGEWGETTNPIVPDGNQSWKAATQLLDGRLAANPRVLWDRVMVTDPGPPNPEPMTDLQDGLGNYIETYQALATRPEDGALLRFIDGTGIVQAIDLPTGNDYTYFTVTGDDIINMDTVDVRAGEGDINGDGFIDGTDLHIVLTNWGQYSMTHQQGDANGDGYVDINDYNAVVSEWGWGVPPEPPSEAIPEPATLGLLLFGGLAMLRRRRHVQVEGLHRRGFGYPNRIIYVCVLAVLLVLTGGLRIAQALQSGQAGFGQEWVSTNQFTIMGTSPVCYDDPNGAGQYWDTNHTAMMLSDGTAASLAQGWTGQPYFKSWHRNEQSLVWDAPTQAAITADLAVARLKGFLLKDEPDHAQITSLGAVAAGIRGLSTDQLVYVNLSSGNLAELDYLISTVNPDVLMADSYPFQASGGTNTDAYFGALTTLRNKGLSENLPYWAYVQSFGGGPGGASWRESSESDMRMNIYSYLTAGYTGLDYFTHMRWTSTFDHGLMDDNLTRTPMGFIAQDVNLEVQKLGQVLRLLSSTDVRFVPDEHAAPTGLSNWSAGAGGDTNITNVAIDGSQTGVGYRNGMIGFFSDEYSQDYFMLTNLDHAAATSAAAASLDFTVTFDSSVNELLRINRETGVQEVVALSGNQLQVTLPGGTGDLYKYNTGDFAPGGPPMSFAMVEVTGAGAPVGYTAYDIMATTGSNLELMELILDADTTGDIHQVSSDPANSTDPFDTYVTMPVTFSVIGAAIDIDPLASQVWDDDELNVAWTPVGGAESSPGAHQIARVVLKNSASGTYTVKGWQTGALVASELSVSFGLLGDVNGDGFVGGGDLNAVLSNWGLSGARRGQGDLTGEGDVGGADYNQVLGNWGAGTPTEPPGAIPEPATLGMLVLGSLVLCRRHRIG